MPESYSVQAVLSVTDKNFDKKFKNAVSTVDELDKTSQKATSSIMDIAKGAGAFKVVSMAADTLQEHLSDAIDRFDTMNRYPKVMEQIGFSAEKSEASVNKLSEGIQGVPTSLDEIVASTQKLALLTGNLDKATDSSLALNDAFYASGASSADASRGLIQYTQMLSKGTVDIVSWRTLQETMGIALREVAEAFGYAGSAATNDLYAALQSGEITFDQLNDKLIELDGGVNGFAERAKTASAGIQTSITNMGIAVTRGMESVIRSTNDALENNGLPGIQEMIENATDGINKAFSVASDGSETLVNSSDILVPVLGTATAGFIAYKAAMNISDKYAAYKKAVAESVDVLNAASDASNLAAKATTVNQKAMEAAASAELWSTKAHKYEEEALKAQTKAKELNAVATKASTEADKQGALEAKLKAAEDKLAAASVKLKAAEEKEAILATKGGAAAEKASLAVTKAKANVDKAAAAVEKAKTSAVKAGVEASELQVVADEASVLATKAQTTADKKSAIASKAKSVAETKETAATSLNTAAEVANTAAETAGTKAARISNVAIATKTALLGVLSGEYTIVEAGQIAWNAAMTANPIGTVIVSATALAAVLVGVSKALSKLNTESVEASERRKDLSDSTQELIDSLESTKDAYDDNATSVKSEASANEKLASKIEKLAKKESKSADEKAKLQAYVESLNSSMEDLNLEYDEENDQLSMSIDAIKAKVAAYKAQAEAQAAQERYTEVLKEQMDVEEQLNSIDKERNALEEEYQNLNQLGPAALSEYNKATAELTEQEEKLNAKKKELTESEQYLESVMVESQAAAAEATSSSTASQITSLEDLDETTQDVVGNMNDTWQSYVDKATDMFDTLSDKSELSVAEMTENLQENQRIISEWATNIETLAKRGVDEGLLEQLRQAGPESAGYVNAMVQASDAELQQLSTAFANGGETATEALKTAFDLSNVPESVMNLVTETESTLNEQISAIDWSSIGGDVTTGFAGGIESGAEDVATASGQLGTDAENSLRDTTQTHSPSVVFQNIGQDLVAGLAQGLMDSGVAQDAAIQMATKIVQVVQETLNGVDFTTSWNRAFSGVPAAASGSIAKITSVVKSGMSNSTAAVSSGSVSMQKAMKTGMTSMSNTTKTGMTTVEKYGASGMKNFAMAISDGMVQSKLKTANGVTGIASALSPLQSRFYNSGYYASVGLANGITAGAPSAIAAANRLANQVAATMDRSLKIGSPSRVTREKGAFTTEGFVLGLLDDIRDVQEASKRLSEAAIPPGSIANRVSLIGAYSPVNAHDYTGESGATYTIIVPLEIEGREFARATATYTQEELDKNEKIKNMVKGIKNV